MASIHPFPTRRSDAARHEQFDLVRRRCRDVASTAFARAGHLDRDGVFPTDDVEDLRVAGLLAAPLRPAEGGADLGVGEAGARALMDALRILGGANLALGRIYEGHVNAVLLVRRYGSPEQVAEVAAAVLRGAVSGVWNAEASGKPARLTGNPGDRRLAGGKTLASGAGHLTLPLVPVTEDGVSRMVLIRRHEEIRADLGVWTAQGMRASATGSVELTEIPIADSDIVGRPGDYFRQPFFSGGAWRFCAVQLGAMEVMVDLFRQNLTSRRRQDDPFQKMRVAECAMAVETARLWVERAAKVAANDADADAIVGYVNLARLAVERAALEVLDRVQRGVGLGAFLRPDPVERIARDLRTYLRQPAPDVAMVDAATCLLQSSKTTGDFLDGLS